MKLVQVVYPIKEDHQRKGKITQKDRGARKEASPERTPSVKVQLKRWKMIQQ